MPAVLLFQTFCPIFSLTLRCFLVYFKEADCAWIARPRTKPNTCSPQGGNAKTAAPPRRFFAWRMRSGTRKGASLSEQGFCGMKSRKPQFHPVKSIITRQHRVPSGVCHMLSPVLVARVRGSGRLGALSAIFRNRIANHRQRSAYPHLGRSRRRNRIRRCSGRAAPCRSVARRHSVERGR